MASLLDVKAPLCQTFKIHPRVIYNHAWKIDRKSLLTFDFPEPVIIYSETMFDLTPIMFASYFNKHRGVINQ